MSRMRPGRQRRFLIPPERYAPRVSNLPPPPPSAAPSPWVVSPTVPVRPSRTMAIASIAIAVVALGVAIGSWFRPLPVDKSAAPSYTSQQVTDAKSKVCAEFTKANNAVRAVIGRDKGSDYATQLASAVNVRQALLAGSQSLSTTLSEAPATPADIASNVHRLVDAYQALTVALIADASESEKSPILHSGDEATSSLENLCK
jgi:hypothetical protein